MICSFGNLGSSFRHSITQSSASAIPRGDSIQNPGKFSLDLDGAKARRKPLFVLRLVGVSLLRFAVRQFAASLSQLPPRFTRFEQVRSFTVIWIYHTSTPYPTAHSGNSHIRRHRRSTPLQFHLTQTSASLQSFQVANPSPVPNPTTSARRDIIRKHSCTQKTNPMFD